MVLAFAEEQTRLSAWGRRENADFCMAAAVRPDLAIFPVFQNQSIDNILALILLLAREACNF